jgi:hypothetical protein
MPNIHRKRVLNYSWLLDIGCSVLVIEANANSQYRILNNECPRMKSEGLGFCQGHSIGRIPTGVSKPRDSGAFSLLGAGCLLLDIAANTNSQYRILNNEYPRIKSEGLGFCQGHSFGRIPTGVSKPRDSGAFSLLGAGCLLLDIAANTNSQYRKTNAEYPGKRVLNNWWILDIGCSLLGIAVNTNSQYRITNAEYPGKRVLNYSWLLDIGCSVLVIEANANSQYRITNAEYPAKRVLNDCWLLDIGCSVLVIEANMNIQY